MQLTVVKHSGTCLMAALLIKMFHCDITSSCNYVISIFTCSSSEKKDVEDESFHSHQWPPNWPKPPQGNLSNTESNIQAEESRVIKRQTSNHSEKPEDIQGEETEKLGKIYMKWTLVLWHWFS